MNFIKLRVTDNAAFKKTLLLFFVSLLLVTSIGTAMAGDEPFTGPTNWGGTGLMEIPTARVIRESRYRFGASQIDPYRYYYFAMSPLPGLEIGGRITQVLDVPALLSGYGDYKDKAIDFKYQLLAEGQWMPALAIGIMDPHGTRIYPSQYVVASKQIYPFDFTIGFGNGRYGKRPLPSTGEGVEMEIINDNASWRQDGQFFGGIEFAASKEFSVTMEYSPIRYEAQTSDPAQSKYFTEHVPSKFNFGLRWRPLDWLETDLSYQRGNQVGVNVSASFDLGVPMIPLYDHPYKEIPGDRPKLWEERIAKGLEYVGFNSVVLERIGDRLSVEAENGKYFYTPRALGVMLQTINELAPPDVKALRLIIAKNGIPDVELSCPREDAELLVAEKLAVGEFLYLNGIDPEISEGLTGKKLYREWWNYGINPSFRTFLNDPSGFFKYRFGIRGWVGVYPWTGASLVTGLEYYPLNTVSSSNAPPAEAVRSDSVLYQQNKAVLGILMIEQMKKFPHQIYARVAAGILEIEYAGLDWEAATPLWGGRLMVGVSGSIVKKRDPDRPFALKEDDVNSSYKTAFLNTRLNFPEIESSFELKTGQFLAGDRGSRLTLTKFFNGVYLSAWYSWTDTDMFADSFNRGYHDKGVSITIPLRLFEGTDTKTMYGFGISPWTRDVAQDIDHFNTLFDYMGRDTKIYLRKDSLSHDYRNAGLQ